MNPREESFNLDQFFDRLPDDVLSVIFNKVHDVKSLCVSMSVCKRFRAIVPGVGELFISFSKRSGVKDEEIVRKRGFKNLVLKALLKPFYFLSQMIVSKSENLEEDSDSCSFFVPNEILKPFGEIRQLHIRLPCYGFQKPDSSKTGKNNSDSTTFLKWEAEFGSQLHSCVILGAKSWTDKRADEEYFQETEWGIDDGEMKLRIVWTISCLIAASARHYLIQETVKDYNLIENLVVSDESDQGRFCMNREQIEEMKDFRANGSESAWGGRSRLPALSMKMWFAERLDVGGKAVQGSTLVVIRPGALVGYAAAAAKRDESLVARAFSEDAEAMVMRELARKLMVTKKCYTLQMNSF